MSEHPQFFTQHSYHVSIETAPVETTEQSREAFIKSAIPASDIQGELREIDELIGQIKTTNPGLIGAWASAGQGGWAASGWASGK